MISWSIRGFFPQMEALSWFLDQFADFSYRWKHCHDFLIISRIFPTDVIEEALSLFIDHFADFSYRCKHCHDFLINPSLQAVAATAPERLRAGVLGQGASLPGELLAPLARNKSPSVTFNYLCTYDLYGPVRKFLDLGR
jgi:hypothetical protein